MADIAAQREARRRKLAMNAEARMNKLLGQNVEQDSNPEDDRPSEGKEKPTDNNMTSNSNDNTENNENQSPYNLRHRRRESTPPKSAPGIPSETSPSPQSADISSSQSGSASTPYKVVEDPEVPDLAEFLASQEAAKAKERNSRFPSNQTTTSRKRTWTTVQYTEAMKFIGCIITALLSRFSLGFGFQSIFVPFFMFEIIAASIIHFHIQGTSAPQPQASMLSSALMLCGIKPELLLYYNRIMSYIMLLMNDFFTFIFVFVLVHACVG